VFKSGAEFERIFVREESGKARKYGSSFSRREVNIGDSNFERQVDIGVEGVLERDGLWALRQVDARRDKSGEEGDRLTDGGGVDGPGDVTEPCGRTEGAEFSPGNEWRASSWGEDGWMSLSGEVRVSMTTGLRRDSGAESPCRIDERDGEAAGAGGIQIYVTRRQLSSASPGNNNECRTSGGGRIAD
jgi:hypothetical protein